MDEVTVSFMGHALEAREAINIAIVVFSAVLCVLIARFILISWLAVVEYGLVSYSRLGWAVRLNIGLLFIFAGEFLRSGAILEILHVEKEKGTYLSQIVPLMVCLGLIVIGSLCAIRVMTPARWGNWIWIISLVVVLCLIAANWFWY